MIKVLAIGNSFSNNAMTYLHQIARAAGVDLKCVNLFIGGCSLYTHYQNMLDDDRAYGLHINGFATGFKVSIREALRADQWDYITLQQASRFSFDFETYEPYISELAQYVRDYQPKAKLVIHQTWAYAEGGKHLENVEIDHQYQMYERLTDAYARAAEAIDAAKIIPCGEAMQNLLRMGAETIHSDGSHASPGLGCYTLGCTWLEALTGVSCVGNTFRDVNVEMTEDEFILGQNAAHKAVADVKL
ncbi:MAG: DUF4886 domain-containing protein [Clostridia bacterium]|nr:DUF4886 domain-containing protein [Clostridia bacterium]